MTITDPVERFEHTCELSYLRSFILALQPQAVLSKRIYGEAFSGNEYFVATTSTTARGLHAVSYTIERQGGYAIGGGASMGEAMREARLFLSTWSADEQESIFEYVRTKCAVDVKRIEEEDRLEQEARWKAIDARSKRDEDSGAAALRIVQAAPKRRLEIFAKSNGKCHYCSAALTFDGKWHIEHKMPRALMGSDEPSNLVAACVPCNMRKSDKTSEEFIAQLAKEAA